MLGENIRGLFLYVGAVPTDADEVYGCETKHLEYIENKIMEM